MYVVTNSAYILEGSMQTKFSNILSTHANPVQCLAVHPSEHTFVSSSADERLLCKWSAISHRILWKTMVDKPIGCAAFHPDGTCVAIGTSNGRIALISSETGQHILTIPVAQTNVDAMSTTNKHVVPTRLAEEASDDDRDETSSDSVFARSNNTLSSQDGDQNLLESFGPTRQCVNLAFSPNGFLLAVACRDGALHIFASASQHQTFRRLDVKDGTIHLKTTVQQMDWSVDSCYLQIVTEDDEQLFCTLIIRSICSHLLMPSKSRTCMWMYAHIHLCSKEPI